MPYGDASFLGDFWLPTRSQRERVRSESEVPGMPIRPHFPVGGAVGGGGEKSSAQHMWALLWEEVRTTCLIYQ